jgi:hypothetical protein
MELRRIAIVTTVLLVAASGAIGQDCNQILGYIRDTSDVRIHKYASLKRFFCDQEFSSDQEAINAGVKADIPLEGILVPMQSHLDGSKSQDHRRSICQNLETVSDESMSVLLSKANTAVVNAWSACLSTPGVKFWAESDQDSPMIVTLNAKFNPIGSLASVYIDPNLELTPTASLRCQHSPIGHDLGWVEWATTSGTRKYKRSLNHETSSTTCERLSRDGATITLRGNNIEIKPIKLGRVAPPQPSQLNLVKEGTLIAGSWTPGKCGYSEFYNGVQALCGPFKKRARL